MTDKTADMINRPTLPSPRGLPALYLTLDALVAPDGRIMGRQSAGRGLVQALAQRYSHPDHTLPLVCGAQEAPKVSEQLVQLGWNGTISSGFSADKLWQQHDLVYINAPINSDMAWQRNRGGGQQAALSGVTHTICSQAVINQIADYLLAPFQPWDALICTSSCVVKVVENIWAAKLAELQSRLGQPIKLPAMPMLPVIPLGVHWQDYQFDQRRKADIRQQLGIAANAVVILFFGRLSFHAKANPIAMYRAIASAAQASGQSLLLLECGNFANDAIRQGFDELAHECGINVLRLDGTHPQATEIAYLAADIFCSFADNIQESFGLTPIEAMAAGLPVVVSDWDGYKDTVRDGVDGFRIPTVLPEALAGNGLIEKYVAGDMNFDNYIGYVHALCAVDIVAATRALVTLVENATLRKTMGEAGRQRAQTVYDWKVIMSSYHQLWCEQSQMLEAARIASGNRPNIVPPAHAINPLQLFSGFSTRQLHASSTLTILLDDNVIQRHRQLRMWQFMASGFVPMDAPLLHLITVLRQQPGINLSTWQQATGADIGLLARTAIWLMKIGALSID